MDENQPSFAIMGSGGVGGYFGARLAQAGFPVTFIARGPHLEAIGKDGLTVDDQGETFNVSAPATHNPGDIGPVDFVLFSVKLWDIEDAGRACKPLIGPDTAVVSLQNGVESEAMLAAILGAEHVMGGVAEIAATISKPGHIQKVSPFGRIRFGELDKRKSARAERLGRALAKANIDHEHADDISVAIWNKFIFLVALAALTALTRKTIGPVRANPETRALLEQVMAETFSVGVARGIALNDKAVANCLRFGDTLNEDVRASMAIDLNHGRRLELPWLSGAVARLGAELGVSTPANSFISAALTLHTMGT